MWFSLIHHQISWNYKVVFSKKPLFIWSFLNGISHCPRLNEFFPLELNKTESKIGITKCGRFFLTQLFLQSSHEDTLMPSIYLHFHVNLLFDDVTEFIYCPIYQFVPMSILVSTILKNNDKLNDFIKKQTNKSIYQNNTFRFLFCKKHCQIFSVFLPISNVGICKMLSSIVHYLIFFEASCNCIH